MNKGQRFCEDKTCQEEVPSGERRFRCDCCSLLVCGWCRNYVHNKAMQKSMLGKWIPPKKPKRVNSGKT